MALDVPQVGDYRSEMNLRRKTQRNSLAASALAVAMTLAVAAAAVVTSAGFAPSASAQSNQEIAETCGDLAVLGIPEGPFAVEAAENLRARGAPNPPGIDAALDVIVAAANFDTPSPPVADVDAALATLDAYYGGPCANIDRCTFVTQIGGSDEAAAAQAAHLLRRIETPSPPGIDAALALIAGDVDESPFHANVAEARQQVLDYYPCDAGGGEAGGDTGGGDGGELAFTGSTTAPLAVLGIALLAAGAGTLHAASRR